VRQANANVTAPSASNPSPAMKTISPQASNLTPDLRDRIAMKDSSALARKTSASMASMRSITSRRSSRGPRWPIDITVMHTPIMVADVGRMCADRPPVDEVTLLPGARRRGLSNPHRHEDLVFAALDQ
jgi:hypothetical protein